MQITRRQFLKYVSATAAAMGLTNMELQKAIEAFAKDGTPYTVVWLAGQACTGCTMAFSDLMSTGPKADNTASENDDLSLAPRYSSLATPDYFDVGKIDDVLATLGDYQAGDTVDDVLLDVIDLDYHETLSAAAGDLAMDLVRFWRDNHSTPAVLVVEGAIPVESQDAWGRDTVGERACTIGTVPAKIDNVVDSDAGEEVSVRTAVLNLAESALAVVAVGQCASFGGIPAAYSDSAITWSGTGRTSDPKVCHAEGVQGALASSYGMGFWDGSTVWDGTSPIAYPDSPNKLINVPGCPPHPDWIYGTIVRIVLNRELGVPLTTDSVGRPAPYYSETIHGPGGCPRYQDYNDGLLAKRLGDKGCLASIGCYGMSTHSDCAKRGWNNSRKNMNGYKTFCIQGGHPCISCTEPGYPFKINTNG